MSENHDVKILNCIYKNSKMAAESIKKVSEKCDDPDLYDYICGQQTKYEENCRSLERQISGLGGTPEQPPAYSTAMASMGISMKTAMDHSKTNIAKLMYNGTNMGIIDIAETVNHAHNASDEILKQAENLLSAEEQYADGLKRFL